MSSTPAERAGHTAAWRLSALSSVAFALGTGAALLTAYLLVARAIRERSDAWLTGEASVLAEVTETTPAGSLHGLVVSEIAELARHEVVLGPPGEPISRQPIFFLVEGKAPGGEIWVGPEARGVIIEAIRESGWEEGRPFSVPVPGWSRPFRVSGRSTGRGDTVFLGLIDLGAEEMLAGLRRTFGYLWGGMMIFGFAVAFFGTRGVLRRVEEITRTAARVGRKGLHHRVPAGDSADEIGRLAATFNEMLEQIDASVRQIRAVTEGVAHDLRSPITAVRGNLELALTSGRHDDMNTAAASAIDHLDRLLTSLDSILDVAEAEAGALRLNAEPSDVSLLLRDLVEIYAPALEQNGLTLRTQCGGTGEAWLDPGLAQRAISNLLDNAVQHLPAGSTLTVACGRDGGEIFVKVSDDGPGFPPAIRSDLFERFVRGPGSRGHGLGLALVRAIARAHGGSARAFLPEGGGAGIEIRFPLGRSEHGQYGGVSASQSPAPPSGLTNS